MSSENTWLLCSRSRSQQMLKISVSVYPDKSFWTAESFVTKRESKLHFYIQSEGRPLCLIPSFQNMLHHFHGTVLINLLPFGAVLFEAMREVHLGWWGLCLWSVVCISTWWIYEQLGAVSNFDQYVMWQVFTTKPLVSMPPAWWQMVLALKSTCPLLHHHTGDNAGWYWSVLVISVYHYYRV